MSDQAEKKESKVEAIKKQSHLLRGTIAEELSADTTHFSEADKQLLKFHGAYQQDDRDERRTRRAKGMEEAYQFMVRVAIPGGLLTADQYLVLERLADEYANGTLRVTTRQGFQFHGVLKRNLKAHIARINNSLLTTLSACGDVGRNVMACPAPLNDEAHKVIRRLAVEIAAELRPRSHAYHEIWLDEQKHVSSQEEEPLYGDQYLPRKFKTGITRAGDNSIDIYSYDTGLIAIIDKGQISGYNLLVGGGMGMTHNKADTFARLASPLGSIDPQHAVEAVRAIAGIFRDHGNRADRRHARLKYLIEEWGMERFSEEFRRRVPFELRPWRPIPEPRYYDHVGPHPQDDGRLFYGLFIENGRIADRDSTRLKTALRELAARHAPGFTLTPNQNVLLTGLSPEAVPDIERTLDAHGVMLPTRLSAARRYSMACPALPTCGLAMAESERLMPEVLSVIEKELESLGLRDVPITIRMTGCPNGCARPYTADIAFVGCSPGVYNIHVGGGLSGNRLADLYASKVKTEDILPTLQPLLAAWAKQRREGEGLGDFYQRRINHHEPRRMITGKEEPTIDLIQLRLKP